MKETTFVPPDKPHIVVICEGGLVRTVLAHDPSIRVEIIDHDTTDTEDWLIMNIQQKDANERLEKGSLYEIY